VHTPYSVHQGPDLAQTLRLARDHGIDAVILADDAAADFQYGIRPLENTIKRTVVFRSILSAGPEAFLEQIESLRRRFPEILIVPGVEAAPYYHWSGDPLKGLVIHDWNRHLSVAGMESAADYHRLPVIGNPEAGAFCWTSLWPLLLLAAAPLVRRFLGPWTAWSFAALGTALLVAAFPFRRPLWSPYGEGCGWHPYDRLAAFAHERGLLCFWSHPEADTWSKPRRVGMHIKAQTSPYPEALDAVPLVDGFAALREGDRTMTLPGGPWDRAISGYLEGARSKPAWAFGELDFDGGGRAGDIDDVFMDVHASSRTVASLLEALKAGRFESVARDENTWVRLSRWSVSQEGPSARRVEMALDPCKTSSLRASVSLVRDGIEIFREEASLPWKRSFLDLSGAGKRSFYRLDVRFGHNGRLLSNPVFAGMP
jgi:hypothetical protein